MLVHVSYPSTWEAETAGCHVPGQLQYIVSPHLKKQKTKKIFLQI